MTGDVTYANLLALQELATRLGAQVESARDEIGETRDILKDAIDRLIPSFTAARIRAATDGDAAATDDDAAASSDDAARPNTTRAMGTAFSALQFQDISDQLLAHAQSRLTLLLNEINLMSLALEARNSPDNGALTLAQLIDRANDNLADLDVSLQKPVGRAHLGTGEMELF